MDQIRNPPREEHRVLCLIGQRDDAREERSVPQRNVSHLAVLDGLADPARQSLALGLVRERLDAVNVRIHGLAVHGPEGQLPPSQVGDEWESAARLGRLDQLVVQANDGQQRRGRGRRRHNRLEELRRVLERRAEDLVPDSLRVLQAFGGGGGRIASSSPAARLARVRHGPEYGRV